MLLAHSPLAAGVVTLVTVFVLQASPAGAQSSPRCSFDLDTDASHRLVVLVRCTRVAGTRMAAVGLRHLAAWITPLGAAPARVVDRVHAQQLPDERLVSVSGVARLSFTRRLAAGTYTLHVQVDDRQPGDVFREPFVVEPGGPVRPGPR